jgi:glycosyltransferase involved in cell wall biosynthesis
MSLTVLNVSYPLAHVSAGTAGGAEQVLATLDEALVRVGHRSLVLAPHGSQCKGFLLSLSAPNGVLDENARYIARRKCEDALTQALREFPVDVVHLHGLDFYKYLPSGDIPVVVTLHLPPDWYPPSIFQITRPNTYLVCVSYSQRHACPKNADVHAVIENGIALDQFRPSCAKNNYVMGLGRICPEKGFHLAMDACTRARLPFLLGGMVYGYPEHQQYFNDFICPRLTSSHRYLGPIDGRRKQQLLAQARCLVIPSLVSETSSLAAMEAMACGTPVVAFPRGALRELIQDGDTGFLVNNVEEMSDAIKATSKLNRKTCRAYAELRFSADTMTKNYLKLYEQVARGESWDSEWPEGEEELRCA